MVSQSSPDSVRDAFLQQSNAMVQILVQRVARRGTIQIQITMGSFPTERKVLNPVPT